MLTASEMRRKVFGIDTVIESGNDDQDDVNTGDRLGDVVGG